MEKEIYLPEEYARLVTKRGHRRKKGMGIILALLLGLALTGSVVRGKAAEKKMQETQQALAKEVFRFHVLADSDSKADQARKMKVKEAVISYMKKELPKSESAEITRNWALAHLAEIEQTARESLRRDGCRDEVQAEVTWCDFPDKTYGDVTFPAGRYEALRIKIGKAEGQNWWCVLYPNLCFLDAVHAVVPESGKEELREVLSDEEYKLVTAGTDFRIRWYFFGGK